MTEKRLIGLYSAVARCVQIKPAHLHIWRKAGTLAENIMLEFEVPGKAMKNRAAIPLVELEMNGKQNRDDWFDISQPSKNPYVGSGLSKNDDYLWVRKMQHIFLPTWVKTRGTSIYRPHTQEMITDKISPVRRPYEARSTETRVSLRTR